MVAAGTQLSQYRVVRRIGAGGMAEVFLAQVSGAAGFTRPVAIKTIVAAGAAPESISLFLDEARVASLLQHAAIVQTLDLGFQNDTLFIAMEYVPGPPLSRVISELKQHKETMPPHLVAHVGAKIAGALDYAHRRVLAPNGQPIQLVHRDVSPQNILLARSGAVKLTDFGVARASVQTHRTKTGQVRGKAAYMAPEQVRAHPLDGRTDMFALGLVLYEALTGVRPFQRNSDINSMRAIISEDVPPLKSHNANVPEDIDRVITKMLRRIPADRYAHCGEVEEEMLRLLRNHRAIDDEVQALLVRLFGEEQWSDAMPEVEAWQPTIASLDTPVTPRFRSGPLSPEVAALLATPATPADPAAAGLPISAPTAQAVGPASRSSANGRSGLTASAATATRQSGSDVMRGVVEAGASGLSSPISLSSGAIETAIPEGAIPRGPLSPTSTPALLSSPTSLTSPISVVSDVNANRWRIVFLAAAALLIAIAVLAVTRRGERSRPLSAPIEAKGPVAPTLPQVAPARAPEPGTTPPPAANETPPLESTASPPAETAGGERTTRAPRTEPEPRTAKEVKERPARETRGTKKAPEVPAPQEARAAPAQPRIDRDAVITEAFALKTRVASKDKDLAKQIDNMAGELAIGREPTAKDLELLKRARQVAND